MAKGTFILSAHIPKTQEQKERVKVRKTNARYFIVVLAIVVIFVYQYCFDTPSQYIEKNYEHQYHQQLNEATFNWLYSIYSFPNVIIPLIGGALIDKIGARVVFIITCAFCVLGQFICSFGAIQGYFWLMLVGRAVFGIGGQVLQGSQSTIISNWFRPEELSLVLGICISFPKMGSALNNYITPIFAEKFSDEHNPYNYNNVAYPMFIAFYTMCFGLICTIVLAYIDRRTQQKARILRESAILGSNQKFSMHKSPKAPIRDISQLTGGDLVKSYTIKVEQKTIVNQNEIATAKEQTTGEHISIKDILKLPGSYWCLIVVATLAETLFIPFLDNGNKYYTAVFIGIDKPDEAGIYLVVPYVLGAVLVPILSLWVDKVQKKSYLIILTCLFFLLTYLTMFYAETDKALRAEEWIRWVPVSFMGIGIGMFCTVIIPTLPMIVNPKLLGTAFGLMEVLQNLALGIFPIAIGKIRQRVSQDTLQGFHEQSMFLFVVSCLCLGMAFILKAVDLTTGSKIDKKDFRKKYIVQVLKESVNIEEY